MNTKPTIYLHIGAGKTGTSTIQSWLKQNQQNLHDQGYLIFDSDFSPNPVNNMMSNQQMFFQRVQQDQENGKSIFQSQLRNNIDYMRENNYHSAIISAELILVSFPQLSTWIAPFIDECNWKIIAYVRNQPQYLISAWKEWGYWQYNFDEMFQKTKHMNANWYKLLDNWSQVFGTDRIYVGIFDKQCLVNESIIEDFAKATNVAHLIEDSSTEIKANPSLNNKTALLLSNIRKHNLQRVSKNYIKPNRSNYTSQKEFRDANREYFRELRETFQTKQIFINSARITSTQEHDSSLSLATQAQLDFIYDQFKDSNAELIATYRPDVDIDIAFPHITSKNHVDYTDTEILYYGFQIMSEITEDFMEQIKTQNEIIKIQNTRIQSLEQLLHQNIQQLLNYTSAHDTSLFEVQKQFAGVQQQLEQVQQQFIVLHQTTHTNPIKYLIIRLRHIVIHTWHRLSRRSK
ncbi:MAG: hypothetical protein ACO3F2_10115 [Roseiflexaceae bacterium]